MIFFLGAKPVGVTYRSRTDLKINASPKTTTIWVDSSQILAILEYTVGSSMGWRASFPSDSVGLNLF